MNIALFGGTFDPIHSGHLVAARAAARRFRLDQVLFIPTGNPPHKIHDHLTDYAQRLAMVALACAGNPRFIPSAMEAPTADGSPRYSIDTVRRVRRRLGKRDHLFFLLGADSFLDLPQWKEADRLIRLADFIVVSRPGFDVDAIRTLALHPGGRGAERVHSGAAMPENVHLLLGVDMPAASRDIRQAVQTGRRVTGLVPKLVEEYILKEGLYRLRTGGGRVKR